MCDDERKGWVHVGRCERKEGEKEEFAAFVSYWVSSEGRTGRGEDSEDLAAKKVRGTCE